VEEESQPADPGSAGKTAAKQGGHKPQKPGILGDFSEHGKLMEFSGNSAQP